MKYRITHRTHYRYSQPVVLCHNEARLQPRQAPHQACLASTVMVEPTPAEWAERQDFFGNRVLYFAVEEPHQGLTVSAISDIELASPPAPPGLDASPAWEALHAILLEHADAESRLARQFVLDSPCAAAAADPRAYAEPSFPSGRPVLAAVADLSRRIHREFRFDPQSTTVATPVSEVLAQRHGVCQDFAHLAIACLRSLGLPARYVSGYLETEAPAGLPRLQGADLSHAWFAVYVPGVGWVDFDPTNDCQPSERHVTTAWGRDYGDVTPLKGVIFGGGAHTLEVSVDMARVEEAPPGA
jgi:transglutaminase-like putative cysteine protease